ncbi:MAG: hypothetical protein K0R18_298 [Bacillales bacterium]|jgi:hypothetical protein|nr:hypothetical protein [Bacillales bacterium]
MASSLLRVSSALRDEPIRRYGGTSGAVKAMKIRYEQMTLREFLLCHPNCNEMDYLTMKLETEFRRS